MHNLLNNIYSKIELQAPLSNIKEALIEYLNFCDVRARIHPLGFYVYNLGYMDGITNIRFHVWDKSLDVQNKDLVIHNHPFNLKSLVLVGEIQNNIYNIDAVADGEVGFLYSTSYIKSISSLKKIQVAGPARLIESYNIKEGEYYSLESGRYHESIYRTQVAATLLITKMISATPPLVYSKYDHLNEINFTRQEIPISESNGIIKKIIRLIK